MNDGLHPLDRFACGPAAPIGALMWGLAEATLFFIVPDVILTVIACRSLRAAGKATLLAILGALCGGMIMYVAAGASPEALRSTLLHIPGISSPLVERVQAQLSERGLLAVLIGPTEGVPYKIYAVEWGASHGEWQPFLLISIPARGIRFLLGVLLAGGIARLIAPWTKRRANVELAILVAFWLGFYTFYFRHFGG